MLGRYSDIQAAPVIHADLWGSPYEDITPEPLLHLSRILGLPTARAAPAQTETHLSGEIKPRTPSRRSLANPALDGRYDLDEPSLIVSIEADAPEFGWNDWVGVIRPKYASADADAVARASYGESDTDDPVDFHGSTWTSGLPRRHR